MSGTGSTEEFPFRVRLGIFLLFESAGFSACAVTILLSYVATRAFKRFWGRRALRKRMRNEWLNLRVSGDTGDQTDATDSSFFIGLMLGELIQAIGGMFDIKWVLEGNVTQGSLCTAQGLFKQYGDVTVAFMSLTIAIQTFCVLVIRWYIPRWASKYILAANVVIVTLLVGTSAGVLSRDDSKYYGDTGYWCWIGNNYKAEKIVFEYLWMWLAAFIMLCLYGVIALVLRGVLVIGDEQNDERRWTVGWNWQLRRVGSSSRKRDLIGSKDEAVGPDDSDEERRQAKVIANRMLFYPAVYIFCVFPVAVARWLAFSGHSIHPAATLVTDFIFTLSGLLNSILYVVTRPELVKGSNTDCGAQITLGTGAVQRQTSREQSKGNLRSKNRSIPHLHGLGHLPDKSEDDIREHETRTTGDADDSPWVTGRSPSQPSSHTLSTWQSRYRSGSLDSASGSAVEDGLKLNRLRSISVDTPPIHLGGVSMEGHIDRHLYRKTSPSQRPGGPRKLESPGLGFLPDTEADLGRDYGMGDPSQPDPVQAVDSRQRGDQMRWVHWDTNGHSDVVGLPPEREASESVRWSGSMEGAPRAL